MDNGRTLAELRLALVEARSSLRQEESIVELLRAIAEQSIIDRAGGEQATGANAEARKRHLILHLGDDGEFCKREERLDNVRKGVEELTALVANAEDERRERERLTREKLADALLVHTVENLNAAIDERVALAIADFSEKLRARNDMAALFGGGV